MISTFWLVLGYACNNRCPHCYAAPSGFSSKWMDIFFAKEVMTVLKKGGAKTCLLIGGEPMLCPNLTEFISFGSKEGLKMVIVSNGRQLKDRHLTKQLFATGLDRAVISLEGATKVIHNTLTGRDSFDDTINGIKACAEMGLVNTLTTVCKGNSHQIIEIVKLAYKLGAKRSVLNCAIPIVNQDTVVADQSLNPTELAKVVDEVFWKLKEENLPFQLNATFPLCLLSQKTLSEAFKLDWISVGCHMYRGKGVIFDPEGNILPCTHFSEMPLIENTMGKNGHFKLKKDFWKIWKNSNSVVGKFRSALWRYPAKKCAKCEYWGGCIGGCPLLWTYFDPRIFIDKKEA